MSEHTPITGELREAVEWEPTFCGPDRAMVPQPEFDRICDAIDAIHEGLERENAELRERLGALDNRSDSMHEIGSAIITITPTVDWTGVARELRSIADTLSSCNCSNSERTETCHNISKVMDEHGQARFVCSECCAWIDSRMLWNPEYRNGESPWVSGCKLNFCPNCGRKVVDA